MPHYCRLKLFLFTDERILLKNLGFVHFASLKNLGFVQFVLLKNLGFVIFCYICIG